MNSALVIIWDTDWRTILIVKIQLMHFPKFQTVHQQNGTLNICTWYSRTHTCFSFRALKYFCCTTNVKVSWMSWLCKPGSDGADPDDPGWTRNTAATGSFGTRTMRQVDWKCGGGAQKQQRKGKESKWKQGDGDTLGGVVASGGPVTDWKWHVVFPAAAIHPRARRRLLHPLRRQTAASDSQRKGGKIGQKNISAQVRLWNSETRIYWGIKPRGREFSTLRNQSDTFP